jgi:hypothetical protein
MNPYELAFDTPVVYVPVEQETLPSAESSAFFGAIISSSQNSFCGILQFVLAPAAERL